MAAFFVAALPRRVRLFAESPTADLAGRTSCYALRAGIPTTRSALRASRACLLVAEGRIKPFPSDAGHVFAYFDETGFEPLQSAQKAGALSTELFDAAPRA